ncbi:MAG: hypothetical protein WCD79_06365 [Chthoniobacteraceae bacterium]
MKLTAKIFGCSLGMLLATSLAGSVYAGDVPTDSKDSSTAAPADTRYGLFDLLDHRSSYGQGVYPEPFLVDDSDLEVNEFRADWLFTHSPGVSSNFLTTEVEKGFGLLTVELEVHYETDTINGVRQQGFDNVDVGARYPLYQYVSKSGFFDTTFGTGIEVGIPTNSPLSKNTEVVPKVFNDTKIGDHLTVQSIFGYSALLGSDAYEGGVNTFEYGFVFGYTVPHKDLPIPGVQQLIPVFELSGERGLSKDADGQNNIVGNIGFRVNTDAIGPIQPRLGVGFVFPMDHNARDDQHWGVVTSLVFEY